jgi:hypothetical protein
MIRHIPMDTRSSRSALIPFVDDVLDNALHASYFSDVSGASYRPILAADMIRQRAANARMYHIGKTEHGNHEYLFIMAANAVQFVITSRTAPPAWCTD